MQWLVRHGVPLNASDDAGATPLHWAVGYGREAAAEWLMDHGAQRDARDHFGRTPRFWAAHTDLPVSNVRLRRFAYACPSRICSAALASARLKLNV